MAEVLDNLLPRVAAQMRGDHVGASEESDRERICLEGEPGADVAHRHRVVIGLKTHPARRAHQHLA